MRTWLIAMMTTSLLMAASGCRSHKTEAAAGSADAAKATAAAACQKDFNAKTAEVEKYMRDHDAANTPGDELRAALAGYEKDFRALGVRARPLDAALASRCELAAESMALYVESLNFAPDDPRALERALAGEAKWRQARGMGGPMPA